MRVSSTYKYSKIHCRTNQSFLRNGKVCVYSCEFPCICIESDGIYMGPYDITQNLFIVFILLSTLLRNHFTLHICFRVVGRDSSKGQILLNSHYDVVPVQEEDWTVPAFDGLRLDGKVYGRGTQDMKCVCIQVVVHLFSPSSPSYYPSYYPSSPSSLPPCPPLPALLPLPLLAICPSLVVILLVLSLFSCSSPSSLSSSSSSSSFLSLSFPSVLLVFMLVRILLR